MTALDDMPFDTVIDLFNQKHDAIKKGNLNYLIKLKQSYPELFIKEKDDQIRSMVQYMKEFQASARYKELEREELKSRLSIIKGQGQ